MRPHVPRAVAGLAIVAALPLAGCASSSGGAADPRTSHSRAGSAAPAGACRGDIGAQLCVAVSLTGADAVHGSGRMSPLPPPGTGPGATCAQLARAGAGGPRELGGALPAVAGHPVVWAASFAHFAGPRRYALSAAEFHVAVDADAFNLTTHAHGWIDVHPDFSVSITFAGVGSTVATGSVSGAISWTCGNPA